MKKRDKIKLLEQVINILYPDASDNELYDVAFNIEFIDKLKELQAENDILHISIEKLKGDLYITEDSLKDCQAHYDRLQAKNEELEKENADLKFYIDSYRQTWELDKYKQALEEVREIAKLHQYFNPEILEIKGNIGQIQDLKMTEIYEKINEVLK